MAVEASDRTSVAVVVTTYQRNGPLRHLLETVCGLAASAEPDGPLLGVVVVDDNPDGRAAVVARAVEGRVPLGVHYRHTGSRNISIARNEALAGGVELAEWVAMIDDDCEPSTGWITGLLAAQAETGADLVTGARTYRAAVGAPRWFTDQGFQLDVGEEHEDLSRPTSGHTANVLISSEFLREHPEVRFRPELGRTGGEDMVFFGAAEAAGAIHRFSAAGAVTEVIPLERTTMAALLRYSYWFGNNEAVINSATRGASRGRLLLRGARRTMEPLVNTVLGRNGRRTWRRAAYDSARGVGLLAGVVGIRVDHHR